MSTSVRVRHDDHRGGRVTTTFLSAAHDTAAGEALVTQYPELADRIRAVLPQLLARDGEMMRWLGADPANAALFARDPLAAVGAALPDVSLAGFSAG